MKPVVYAPTQTRGPLTHGAAVPSQSTVPDSETLV